MTFDEQIEDCYRELHRIRVAEDIAHGCLDGSARKRVLHRRIAALAAEAERIDREERRVMREFEARQGVTRVAPSPLVPLGMDETPGEGAHHHDIMEDEKPVRRL